MTRNDNFVALDLKNYPHLRELYMADPERFGHILKAVFQHIDHALEDKRFQQAKRIYKMDYIQMMFDVIDTFFNFQGIVNQHGNPAERDGLTSLGEDIHPLGIFTNNVAVFDVNGRQVDPHEWISLEDFNLKDWLYALFYGARFVSWKELAEYLTLGQFELIEVLKARNFEQLKKIQPALHYQEKQGITVGKLIQGTGFLYCGDETHKTCPACEVGIIEHAPKTYSFCNNCFAGFKK